MTTDARWRHEVVGGLADLVAGAAGTVMACDHAALWVASPRLAGVTLWSTPSPADIAFLVRGGALTCDQRPAVDWLVDVRQVVRVTNEAFATLDALLLGRSAGTRRHVIVAPRGLLEAAAYGVLGRIVESPRACVVHAPAEALAWLGHGQELAQAVDDVMDNARAQSTPALVRRWMSQNPTGTLRTAAATLGLSPRSLQRQLHLAKTSFREQQRLGRIDAACGMLTTSADKIEVIARAAGWQSSSSFVRAFRTAHGATPHAWRARRQTRLA